jgi:hypothetical protein
MSGWWDFGEWSGYHGRELATHRITCAFCKEAGNFETVHHTARQGPERKVLN